MELKLVNVPPQPFPEMTLDSAAPPPLTFLVRVLAAYFTNLFTIGLREPKGRSDHQPLMQDQCQGSDPELVWWCNSCEQWNPVNICQQSTKISLYEEQFVKGKIKLKAEG